MKFFKQKKYLFFTILLFLLQKRNLAQKWILEWTNTVFGKNFLEQKSI